LVVKIPIAACIQVGSYTGLLNPKPHAYTDKENRIIKATKFLLHSYSAEIWPG